MGDPNGQLKATYLNEFACGENSSPATSALAKQLQEMNVEGDPSQCYVALYAGPNCSSDGGVYLISPDWYAGHFGGDFGKEGFCGKVHYNWFQSNPSHQGWGEALSTG